MKGQLQTDCTTCIYESITSGREVVSLTKFSVVEADTEPLF